MFNIQIFLSLGACLSFNSNKERSLWLKHILNKNSNEKQQKKFLKKQATAAAAPYTYNMQSPVCCYD